MQKEMYANKKLLHWTHMKSNRFIGGMGERLGLVEWHRILSDLKCC